MLPTLLPGFGNIRFSLLVIQPFLEPGTIINTNHCRLVHIC